MKNIFLLTTILALTLASCYKDVAEKPDASFISYLVDPSGAEILTDTVKVNEEVHFKSTGSGEYFVIWPGEKRINLSGYTYSFTQDGISGLAQQFVPDSIITSLSSLVGKSYTSDSKASTAIFNAIGGGSKEQIVWDTYYTYEYPIKVSAVTLNPDSTYFKYNHDYEDYTSRLDNGFYNVNGISTEFGKKEVKFIYKLPGIYTVTFVARGIENFGSSQVEDRKTKIIVVKPSI